MFTGHNETEAHELNTLRQVLDLSAEVYQADAYGHVRNAQV